MSDIIITESIDIPSPDGPVCRVHRFASGRVALAFDRPGVTLSVYLSAEEASALAEALGETRPEDAPFATTAVGSPPTRAHAITQPMDDEQRTQGDSRCLT